MPEPRSPRDGQPLSGRNTTAERAIDVLLLFGDGSPVLSANEVASRLGMSRSTTYRYLQSLQSYDLLEVEDARGGYRLGPRIFELARVARQGLGLSEVALPQMRSLAAATGEAVLLTRRFGRHVVCVEREESRHPIRLSYERGHILPLHAGASAKVLLAFTDTEAVDALLAEQPLPRLTPKTITDPDQLRSELSEIRARGYVVTDGEVDDGVRGIGAPVFYGKGGQLAAGLSVAGPIFRLTDQVLPEVVDAVVDAARRLTERLELTTA